MSEYISVSMKGDKETVARLKAVASINRKTIGELVADAINAQYGAQMEKIFGYMSNPLDNSKTKNAQE